MRYPPSRIWHETDLSCLTWRGSLVFAPSFAILILSVLSVNTTHRCIWILLFSTTCQSSLGTTNRLPSLDLFSAVLWSRGSGQLKRGIHLLRDPLSSVIRSHPSSSILVTCDCDGELQHEVNKTDCYQFVWAVVSVECHQSLDTTINGNKSARGIAASLRRSYNRRCVQQASARSCAPRNSCHLDRTQSTRH